MNSEEYNRLSKRLTDIESKYITQEQLLSNQQTKLRQLEGKLYAVKATEEEPDTKSLNKPFTPFG